MLILYAVYFAHKGSPNKIMSKLVTVESGKNVTFFLTSFLLLPIGFGSLKDFWGKVKIVFYFLSETELVFFVAMEEKLPFPIYGDLGEGETWVREKSFLRLRVKQACTTRLFLLDHRTTCTVFPVFAMFAMTTMADSRTLTPVPQVTSIKAG